jgi:hypothetical protein
MSNNTSIVVELLYLACATRPDLAHSASVLTRRPPFRYSPTGRIVDHQTGSQHLITELLQQYS